MNWHCIHGLNFLKCKECEQRINELNIADFSEKIERSKQRKKQSYKDKQRQRKRSK